MKYLIFLLFVVTLVHSQTANCKVREGMSLEKVYITQNETQAFSFRDYFTGFNLYYHAKAAEKTYKIIQSIYETSRLDIPTPPQNYSILDFDIHSDSNGTWKSRASSLGIVGTDYWLRYGSITENWNVNMNAGYSLNLQGKHSCFDVVTVGERSDVVDCYNYDTKQDVLYIFDEASNKIVQKYTFPCDILGKDRKTIPYHISGNRMFLLSATLASESSAQANSSYVRIYALDYANNISLAAQVNATSFELGALAISDIAVDALENIYITDIYGTLIQFSFDGEKVVFGGKWNLETPLFKVSVYIAPDMLEIIQVVAENSIIEIDLGDKKAEFIYQIPVGAGKKAVDFQTNSRVLVVQTDKYYYVYERYNTDINQMLALYETGSTLLALSPRSPHIIVLAPTVSRALFSSQSFLLINNIQDTNQTITISAASQNPDGQNPVCVVEFLVTSVQDTSGVFIKRDFNASTTAQNPAYELYKLDQYFLGSRLTYEPQPGKDTTLNLQYINKIYITSDNAPTDVNWFACYSYALAKYFRLFQVNGQLTIQNCQYDGENVVCKTINSMDFKEKIIFQAFFESVVDMKNVPMFAFVTESNPHVIRIFEINNAKKDYAPIIVNEQFNITDLDINERFIYATVADARLVYVFKNDFNNYIENFIIDESILNIDHPTFYPVETILPPRDKNLLIIQNVNSLILLEITAFTHELIAQIPLPQLSSAFAKCKVVASEESLMVFIRTTGGPDEILEYGIKDIYNPTLMRSIDLDGKSLKEGLQVIGISDGNVVAVQTTNLKGEVFLTMIRAGEPKVNSVIADINAGNSSVSSLSTLVSLGDSAIIEIYLDANKQAQKHNHLTSVPQDANRTSMRYYYVPLLLVRAHLDSGFKDTFAFGLNVIPSNSSKAVNVAKSITVYNVKSKIQPSSKEHDLVVLPNNANSDQPVFKQIYPDQLFIGPVAKYQIKCPICESQIKLWDHVYGLATSDALVNVKAYHFFEQKSRLWALTDAKIHITDSSLQIVSSFGFDFSNQNISAKNWFVGEKNNIQVLFTNSSDNNQFMVEVVPSDDRASATIKTPVQIANNPGMSNAQTIKSQGSRVFVHDAKFDDISNNKVHVLTVSNNSGAVTINYESTIDVTTFGQLGENGVNDFELVPTNTGKTYFVATLGKAGLGWFTFDKDNGAFAATQPGSYNLNNNPSIANNLISEDTNYLQFKFTSLNVNTDVQAEALLTVDNGQHFHLKIAFNLVDGGLEFKSLDVITTFGKYGKERVLNWLQRVSFKDHAQNLFLIAHQGANNNVVSFSLYDLQYGNSSNVQQMMGAVVYTANKPLSNNLAARLFRDGNDLKLVYTVNNDYYPSGQLYNLSKEVYLSYKYDEIKDDFSNINIIASNNYGQTEKLIPVKIDRPNDKGGLAWYVYVGIGVGALVVIGLIAFFVIRHKRKNAPKDSLLSTSKHDDDDD